jgi:hypothetical protein
MSYCAHVSVAVGWSGELVQADVTKSRIASRARYSIASRHAHEWYEASRTYLLVRINCLARYFHWMPGVAHTTPHESAMRAS